MIETDQQDSMTLREVVEDVIGFDESDDGGALTCLMGAFQILRSAYQGESATLEGVCGSINEWMKLYGHPTEASVRQWLDDIKAVSDLPIPLSVIAMAMEGD